MPAVTTVEDLEWMPVEDPSAPGRVRRAAIRLAERLGFGETRAGEVGIVATELGTNLVRHATGGTMVVRARRAAEDAAVELLAIDGGPGVHDLDTMFADGTSSVGTLGIGLGAAIRLATRFDAHSVPGRGTVAVATFWGRGRPADEAHVGTLTRPMTGEEVCGDTPSWRVDDGALSVLLADGLGHGPLAAAASREAARAFLDGSAGDGPSTVLTRLQQALRPTRGAAVAVVRLDPAAGRAVFAGVGNIAASVDDGVRRRALVSSPGIVGHNAGPVREIEVVVPRGSLVVLHSDGLTEKWDLARYPGLRSRDVQLVAATLVRDAAVRRDDAAVVVARAGP